MGDFNEVRSIDERFGSMFNQSSSRLFNHFITSSGLMDVKLEGYSFTWAHHSATKMSKLDRFLVSEGIISLFPSITALCLDRHLSDHRPILLREIHTDYGPNPFCFYHSWFKWDGFDVMVEQAWNSFSHSDPNGLIRLKKKLQDLKKIIRSWIKDKKMQQSGAINSIKEDLIDIDKDLDCGNVFDEILLKRMELMQQLHDINQMEARDYVKKSKIKWAIEGDENSKFFHGITNKKRSQLSIRGVFVDGDWNTDPEVVKDVFKDHFSTRFKQLAHVWNCGENKSSGPDGSSPKGSSSSFIALIPKVTDAKFVTNFRPISLIGCVYKVVTKILANHLATEKKQAVIFKVDFAKAYDSVRWDYLLDVLQAFGFGPNWSSLIGCAVMKNPFWYLGVMVGDSMSQKLAWDDTVQKLRSRLSKWKVKTLSIGVPKGVLKEMEAIRCNFFNGADPAERKITWISWDKVLASKKNSGLEVSSFHALNCALLLKWVWHFLSQDGSFWYRVIQALYGTSFELHPVNQSLIWCSILREMQVLISKGFDFVSHYTDKESTVASKLGSSSVDASFRRSVRDGVERQQWDDLNSVSGSVTLSDSKDRWICDLNGDGVFRVKEVRAILDDIFLSSAADATRWDQVNFGRSVLCSLVAPLGVYEPIYFCSDSSKTFSDL
uniref:RNA-directed DNA polymerase, eukaryota n=1 Tax=Tanacetum cinerariifolium TaxID=118510 RepID=A0A6L2NN50_TANCI|nr:RNA-directed DNA polymerase, eukaryota [Tanacetum cinerariifolium]